MEVSKVDKDDHEDLVTRFAKKGSEITQRESLVLAREDKTALKARIVNTFMVGKVGNQH